MSTDLHPDVRERLLERFGALTPLAGGAWSTALRGRLDGRDVVVRVSEHADDLEADAEVATLGVDGLLAPDVLDLRRLAPPHDHLFVCVTTFCPGAPLEDVDRAQWRALVPAVADVLTAMRTVPAPPDAPSWPQQLLAADPPDDGDARLGGWRARLAALPDQHRAHATAMARLQDLTADPEVADVERTLVHADLIHRNVHVVDDHVTGVFDWGCRRWGDHLYDLAWFVFWQPWHPQLDVDLLRDELVARWGHEPSARRMQVCLLHIGADHLVYNAAIDDPAGGADVLARMRDLGLVDPEHAATA